MNSRVEVGDDLSYLVSLGNALIFRDDSPAIRYVVYLVSPDGSARRMEHDEALASLPENVPGVTVKDGIIYYKGNGLTRNLSFSQVDDDGNFYSGRTVYQGSKDLGTINSTTDSYDNYMQSFIHNEGNFWAMDFTKDEKQSLVLLYSGRDWGYRESPRKAVTTDSGLRIRLRASTDAFVLGSLGKGEAITILKTGVIATIGGITAPWYRIKKADGLIGWAFGGYIKVLE
ncbi:MAG: SH3 domain-containing protein [Spirochaetales bacterium]|nr:SH3 domain-containing protein [Spirochaetales bacterium]